METQVSVGGFFMIAVRSSQFRGIGLAIGFGVAALALPHAAQAVSVTSITPSTLTASRATTETFTVTFSAPVTGVFQHDFQVTAMEHATGRIDYIAGSGDNYTIHIVDIAGTGSLRVDLKGTNAIRDANNNVPSGFTDGDARIVGAPTPIPTLTEWAMILLTLGLGGLAALLIQRRRKTA